MFLLHQTLLYLFCLRTDGPYGSTEPSSTAAAAATAVDVPFLNCPVFLCVLSVRGYSRTVLRPDEAVWSGWLSCQHALPLPGGLRGQGLLQYRGQYGPIIRCRGVTLHLTPLLRGVHWLQMLTGLCLRSAKTTKINAHYTLKPFKVYYTLSVVNSRGVLLQNCTGDSVISLQNGLGFYYEHKPPFRPCILRSSSLWIMHNDFSEMVKSSPEWRINM